MMSEDDIDRILSDAETDGISPMLAALLRDAFSRIVALEGGGAKEATGDVQLVDCRLDNHPLSPHGANLAFRVAGHATAFGAWWSEEGLAAFSRWVDARQTHQ